VSNVSLPPIVQAIRGSRRQLARLITKIEGEQANAELAEIYPHTGQACLVGITGAPGTGKSSLVSALARHYRGLAKTVAILAVDPTSPFTGGAVLGDRIRMRDLAGDNGVFIRSMATRGSLGGLARATANIVRALDAAGFDYIIIETVGAGQSEVDIASIGQTIIVVEAPGLGDDVQAIKAGILEIADILVVNKADRPGLENTVRGLRAMLDLGHRAERLIHHGQLMPVAALPVPDENSAWQPPIMQTVATTGQGITELAAQIEAHQLYLRQSGTLQARLQASLSAELEECLRDALLAQIRQNIRAEEFAEHLAQMVDRQQTPNHVALQMLRRLTPNQT
jgi:LAO/AO transport system kinase